MNISMIQFAFLMTIIVIGFFNWAYRMRIEKLRHQMGIELPGISIALFKIGTFFAVFSVCLILLFIVFIR